MCHSVSICFGSTEYTTMGQPRARGSRTTGTELRRVIYLLFNTIVYAFMAIHLKSKVKKQQKTSPSLFSSSRDLHIGLQTSWAELSFVLFELGSFTELSLHSSSRSACFSFVRAKPCSFTKRASINEPNLYKRAEL